MSSPTVFPPEPPTAERPPTPLPSPPTSPRLPGAPPTTTVAWNPPSSAAGLQGVPQYGGPVPPPVSLRVPNPTAAPSGHPPLGPAPASSPASAPRRGGRALWTVVGALGATALIASGFGLAHLIDDEGPAQIDTAPAPTTTVSAPSSTQGGAPTTTAPAAPPVAGNSAEPAADVAAKVAPSVVRLRIGTGSGSGIVYDKTGLIITNAHVVQGASTVEVKFANGATVANGVVQARDERRDIALVKIPPRDDLVPIVFARNSDVRVGQIAVAIGAPFGLDQTVTQGIVSALNRPQPSLGRCTIDMVQTDAPINPGNSGGALVDRQGRLIGMNTSIRTSSGGNGSIGIGFAVPADTIRSTVDRMVKGETNFELAYLGVRVSEINVSTEGVVLGTVEASSPASRAGLREGDVITEVNGERVTVWGDVRARIQAARPGDVLNLTVKRPEGTTKLAATLDKSPDC